MATVGRIPGRRDLTFARGTTFPWACVWRRRTRGGGWTPVDLTGWDVRMQLLSPRGDVWLDIPARQAGADGVARFEVAALDTAGDLWRGRRSGTWRVLAAQPDGEILSAGWSGKQDGSDSLLTRLTDPDSGRVELVAWGYWRCG